MPRFGDFETVREVSGGIWGAVYVARNPAGDERFAVKVFSPPAYQLDEAQLEQETVSFLEAVQAQSEISAVSAGVWSPVYQADRCEGGAWYTTDLFDRSAEKLVLYRRDLEGAELQHVISSVLQGLAELKTKAGRPHGNIKPTNVLIAGRNDLSKARVALTDLLAGARVRPVEDAARDLREVGDLIHQLVLHRPMKAASAWPVDTSENWTRLGNHAKSWLALCNALLDPTGNLPTLDEAMARLPGGLTRIVAEPPRSSRVGRIKGISKESSGGSSGGSGLGSRSGVELGSGLADEGIGQGSGSELDSALQSRPPASAPSDASHGPVVPEDALVPRPERTPAAVAGSDPSPPDVSIARSSSEFELTVAEEESDPPLALNGDLGATSGKSEGSLAPSLPSVVRDSRVAPIVHGAAGHAVSTVSPSSGAGRWIAASAAALIVVGAAAFVVPKLMKPNGRGTPKAPASPAPADPNVAREAAAKDARDQAKQTEIEELQRKKNEAAAAALAIEEERKRKEHEIALAKQRKEREENERRIEAERLAGIAEAERLAKLENDRELAERGVNEAKAAETAASEARAAAEAAVVGAGRELDALLARAFVPGEAADGGGAIESRAHQLADMPGYSEANASNGELAGVVGRVAGLVELARITDPKAASARALEESRVPGRAAETRQLWLNLVASSQKTWPSTAAAFENARSIYAALDVAYDGLPDKARGARLKQEAMTGVQRLWGVSLGLASTGNGFEQDSGEIERIVAMAGSVGLGPDSVPGGIQFNFLLRDLRARVARDGGNADEATIRAGLGTFWERVQRLPAETRASPEVVAALKVVRGLLDGAAAAPAAGQSPADAGPRQKGFPAGVMGNVEGVDRVVFTGPGGRELAFLRVGDGSFVSTQEVSVGLFIDTVEAAQKWPEIMASLKLQPKAPTQGPRAWDLIRSDKIELATEAIKGASNRSKGWLQTRPLMGGVEVYPPDVVVDSPKPDSPMQYVTPQAAAIVASLLGCRFPTSEEWRAALQVERRLAALPANAGAAAGSRENRRDATWGKVVEQARANGTLGKQPNSPDQDMFTGGQRIPDAMIGKEPAAMDGVGDDRTVWFAPVGQGGGQGFHHLVGNVAEYVYDDPATFLQVGGTSPADFGTMLRKNDQLKVIGASALSPKEIIAETPYPWGRRQAVDSAAPSDVGFRLAFSAVGAAAPSLASRVSDEVLKLLYVPVP